MSLKARLSLLMIALVASSMLALAALVFNGLSSTLLQQAIDTALMTANLVKVNISNRTDEVSTTKAAPGAPIGELKKLWTATIASDTYLASMFDRTLPQVRGIAEISVADEGGRVLTSTNPARKGAMLSTRLNLNELNKLNPLDRFLAIKDGRIDYETRLELGLQKPSRPLFTIQVLTSSVLLWDTIRPTLMRLFQISLAALLVATLLTYWASRLALRPLATLGVTIDRIARGETDAPAARSTSASEVAIVEEKLRLLGEQVRGAQAGASQLRGSVEQLLARLEDVILLAGEDGMVRMCAQPAERLLGRPRAEIIGQPLLELFPPYTDVGTQLAQALAEHRSLLDAPVEWSEAGSGTQLLLSLDYLPESPVHPGGGIVLRLRDQEGRQMLESQLSLATRLTAINRLTGGVAHEIKNPLNSIAIRLELLRAKLEDKPEAGPELDVIAQEIMRLDRVVRTFLDFAKPVEVTTADLDLVQQVEGILTLVRPEAERAGQAIEFLPRTAPVMVRGDADLLRQAILNVVRNAMEATPSGGKIIVTLISGTREAVLGVADSGQGIPVEARDKVFQLYYSTKEGGSGIGLAMAYRAFQLHGGSIEIDDAPHGGALVRFRIPAARAAAAASPGGLV
jgi:signal transduction histidine kinase